MLFFFKISSFSFFKASILLDNESKEVFCLFKIALVVERAYVCISSSSFCNLGIFLYNSSFDRVKHLYDIGMVWTFKTARDENYLKLASICRNSIFMGYCLGRILLPGTGQPDRIQRKRRTFQLNAAKSYPGSYHSCRIHPFFYAFIQRRGSPLEPRCCLCLFDFSRLFCLYEVIDTIVSTPGPDKKEHIQQRRVNRKNLNCRKAVVKSENFYYLCNRF